MLFPIIITDSCSFLFLFFMRQDSVVSCLIISCFVDVDNYCIVCNIINYYNQYITNKLIYYN